MRVNSYKNSPEEVEASVFASELLMNEALFRARMRRTTLEWDTIRGLSDYFQTSLTATAIRYVELSKDPCALVVSRDARIKWFRSSDSFRERFRFAVRSALGEETAAFALAQPGSGLEADTELPMGAWAEGIGEGDEDIIATEHSLRFERYGDVMSLLWLD
jgi:hypothetical protein